jgi:hypothetical protein
MDTSSNISTIIILSGATLTLMYSRLPSDAVAFVGATALSCCAFTCVGSGVLALVFFARAVPYPTLVGGAASYDFTATPELDFA